MRPKDMFWGAVTLIVWYFFTYHALCAIQYTDNVWKSALILLVLGTLGIVTCPWFQHTQAWKDLFKKDGPRPPQAG